MNYQDIQNAVEQFTNGASCKSCGRSYEPADILELGSSGADLMILVDCECSKPAVVRLTAGADNKPVSVDDVLDIHNYLAAADLINLTF